jgi:hypothetical protein
MCQSRLLSVCRARGSVRCTMVLAAALVDACLVPGPASAVDGGPSVFSLYLPYSITRALGEKAVQEDLQMSPQQVKAVKLALDRAQRLHVKDADKAFKAADADRKKLLEDQENDLTRDMFNALAAPLRPEQVKRLKQILHQEKGSALLEHPYIRAIMNISDEQNSQLKAIHTSLQKALVEQVNAGKIPRYDASKYDQLRLKRIPPEVQEALSPDQRRILKDLLGVRLVR